MGLIRAIIIGAMLALLVQYVAEKAGAEIWLSTGLLIITWLGFIALDLWWIKRWDEAHGK